MRFSVLTLLPALGLLSLSTAAPSTDATAVCNEIFSSIPERTAFDPDGPTPERSSDLESIYDETIDTYWDAENKGDRPACILFPSSAEDVSIAVKALKERPSVPFAIKSGGHQFNRGFSSTDGGVLISFRPNLASISLSEDGETAEVGPGARWQEASEALDSSNKCVVGGRIGNVGVGGYTLGGGLSFLTAQHGFASDNVVNYEAVLADGSIVNANETSNTDLYWALRGGGSIFAVVTMFTLKTHDIGDIWGGQMVFTVDKLTEVSAAITNFVANNDDPKAAVIPTFMMIGPVNLINLFTIFFFYDGPEPPAHVFADFDAILPFIKNVKTQRYPELTDLPAASSDAGQSTANGVNSFPNMDAGNMTEFLEWHWNQANEAAIKRSVSRFDIQLFTMAIQPIPASMQKVAAAKGPSPLAMDHRNGDKIWIEYNIGWLNPDCSEDCPKAVKDLLDEARSYQVDNYAGVPPTNYESGDLSYVPYNPLFMNDAQGTQDVLKSYGSDNYQRLKSIHQTLDPDGFFTTRQQCFGFSD
ncbi:hypothetical protein FQN54_004513 [Arachnomyces sp. PD_36]|nr:hypothetical protein FQN54_004513 [Arachnomyces sp. PD_36]